MARLDIDARIEKAFSDDEGKPHIVAIVSSSREDKHGDRMTELAIKSMAEQVSNTRIPLLENHRSSFEMGYSIKGVVERTSKGSDELAVEFELDDRFPEMRVLFDAVKLGNANKQLSIGGYIPHTEDDAIVYERRDDGTMRRGLNKILLDHVAITRVNHAANDDTYFRTGIRKALDDYETERSARSVTTANGGVITVISDSSVFMHKDKDYPLANSNADLDTTQEESDQISKGNTKLLTSLSLIKKEDKPWFGIHHGTDEDGIVKTYLKGILGSTEDLLKDQWNGGLYGLTEKEVRQCADHLIKHYDEFSIDPPLTLKSLSKGILEPWTSEALGEWKTFSESTLASLTNRESNMTENTNEIEEIEEVVEIAEKAVADSPLEVMKASLASLDMNLQNLEEGEKKTFIEELAHVFGLHTNKAATEETVNGDVNDAAKEMSVQEAFVSNAEKFSDAQKSVDTLREDFTDLLKEQIKTLTETLSQVVLEHKDSVLKAVSDVKDEVEARVVSLEKRIDVVEEIEGVSASAPDTNGGVEKSSDTEIWTGVFGPAAKIGNRRIPN